MKKILNRLGWILSIILLLLVVRSCFREPSTSIEDNGKTVEVRLTTHIDTVYVAKNIYHRDTIKVPTLIKADTVFLDGSKQVAMMPQIKREYADSVKVEDSIHVGYKAKVTGTLDNISLTYSNKKSIMYIHKTDSVFTTTIITKKPSGMYIGVNAGLQELSPNLQYIRGDNAYGIKYNIVSPGVLPVEKVSLSYSRKLF